MCYLSYYFKLPVSVKVALDCVVPDLKGKTLKAAKKALHAASCKLGDGKAQRSDHGHHQAAKARSRKDPDPRRQGEGPARIIQPGRSSSDAGGGTRTPDTRIMIPLL